MILFVIGYVDSVDKLKSVIMKKVFGLLCLILLFFTSFSQSVVELSVYDDKTKEPITCFELKIDKDSVFICDSVKESTLLHIPGETKRIYFEISSIGYLKFADTLDLNKQQNLSIFLKRTFREIPSDSVITHILTSFNYVVFLDWKWLYTIDIYENSYAKEIVSSIQSQQNDEDDIVMVNILGFSSSMYYVEFYSGLTDYKFKRGWIRKESPIYSMLELYTPYDTIELYEEIKGTKSIIHIITADNAPSDGMVKILDIDSTGEYFKVEFYSRNKKLQGWVSISDLCGNPYTTCG